MTDYILIFWLSVTWYPLSGSQPPQSLPDDEGAIHSVVFKNKERCLLALSELKQTTRERKKPTSIINGICVRR